MERYFHVLKEIKMLIYITNVLFLEINSTVANLFILIIFLFLIINKAFIIIYSSYKEIYIIFCERFYFID